MARSARLATIDEPSDQPEFWLAAIDRALEEGSLREARRIAEEGAERFPSHKELARLSRALRPGKAVSVPGRNIPDQSKAFQRLEEEAWRLRGKWVALSADDVVASANTLEELLAIVQPMKLEFPPLVHQVDSVPLKVGVTFPGDPQSWLGVIRRCLAEGVIGEAGRLAAEGAAKFSENEELQRMQRIFGRRKATPPATQRCVSQRILEDAAKLRGTWVALSTHEILASAGSLEDLLAKIRPMDLEHPPLVSFVA